MAYRKIVKPLKLQVMVKPNGSFNRWEWREPEQLQDCEIVEMKQNENVFVPIKF